MSLHTYTQTHNTIAQHKLKHTYTNRNNVEIPHSIKRSLHQHLALKGGSGSSSKYDFSVDVDVDGTSSIKSSLTHQDFLKSSREKQSLQTHPLIQTWKERGDKLQLSIPTLDLRIKNGKYSVINQYDEDPNKEEEREQQKYEAISTTEGEESPPRRRAKQHINTIATSGPLMKIWRKIKRIVTTGKLTNYKKETIIIDNINLVFTPGKMVLMLGGPGSGT